MKTGSQFHLIVIIAIFSVVKLANAQIPVFDADRAFQNLITQCDFGPRNPGSQGHSDCKEWVTNELINYADEVHVQSFNAVESLTGDSVILYNIIGQFGSFDESALMLCAHWDTRVYADQDKDEKLQKTPIMGANDAASGVAVILEICQILSENPPPRPITVVFFDGEDMGRSSYPEEFALGSAYWAQHPIPGLPEEAILLDMVGDADLEFPIEVYSNANARNLTERLWNIAEVLELDAFQDYLGIPVADDHLNLLRVGVRAVDIIDFDYPYWHTSEDTPDKCSAESLGQVGKLLIAYIYGIE
jgi:Zn-dependent M28 family amino/carboxypeptidase